VSVPGYWMNEQSGLLEPVVRKYLEGGELAEDEIVIMRAYLHQWMSGDFRGPGVKRLRSDVEGIDSNASLRSWLDYALDLGIDPL
jgi:hypothetical protein